MQYSVQRSFLLGINVTHLLRYAEYHYLSLDIGVIIHLEHTPLFLELLRLKYEHTCSLYQQRNG